MWNVKFADTSVHEQHWESNPRPFDLEFNALATWPHATHIPYSASYNVNKENVMQVY